MSGADLCGHSSEEQGMGTLVSDTANTSAVVGRNRTSGVDIAVVAAPASFVGRMLADHPGYDHRRRQLAKAFPAFPQASLYNVSKNLIRPSRLALLRALFFCVSLQLATYRIGLLVQHVCLRETP